MRLLPRALSVATVLVALAVAAGAKEAKDVPVSLAFATRTVAGAVDATRALRFGMAFQDGAADVSGRAASDLRRHFADIRTLLDADKNGQILVAVVHAPGDAAAREFAYLRARAIRVRLLDAWPALSASRVVVAALAEDAVAGAGNVLVAPIDLPPKPGEEASRHARAVALDSAFVGPVDAALASPGVGIETVDTPAAPSPVEVAAAEPAPVAAVEAPVAAAVPPERPQPAPTAPVGADPAETIVEVEIEVAAVPPLPTARPAADAASAAPAVEPAAVPAPKAAGATAPATGGRAVAEAPVSAPAHRAPVAAPAARAAKMVPLPPQRPARAPAPIVVAAAKPAAPARKLTRSAAPVAHAPQVAERAAPIAAPSTGPSRAPELDRSPALAPALPPVPAPLAAPPAAARTVVAAVPAAAVTCARPAVIIDDFYPGGPIVPCPAPAGF